MGVKVSTIEAHLRFGWWYRETSFFEPGQILFSRICDGGHLLEGGGRLWVRTGLDLDLHSHQQIAPNMVDVSGLFCDVSFDVEGMVVSSLERHIFNEAYFISIGRFLFHRNETFPKDTGEIMSI